MSSFGKRILAALIALVVIGAGIFFFVRGRQEAPISEAPQNATTTHETIGASVEGRAIDAYTYGTGATHLLFVGGIHGGYEWNSVLLAYEFMDYFEANSEAIPPGLTVTIVPSANPDGIFAVTGKQGRFVATDVNPDATVQANARFNARGVDLNRNFDCKWQPESTWRSQVVSAGTSAFSEPEAVAIQNFVLKNRPSAVVFWHSQSNAVYASECENGILPGTLAVMNAYARGSGYPAVSVFDAYTITGDAEGWLASINIPAVTVELSSHETIEWERNRMGVEELFKLFASAN